MSWIVPGAFLKTSWNTGPYRIDHVVECNEKNCFVYWYDLRHKHPAPHLHLALSDIKGDDGYGIGGVFSSGQVISLDDDEFITQATIAKFNGQKTAQLELFA